MSNKVKAILIIVPLVILAGGIGGAYAYFTAGTDDSGPSTTSSPVASVSAPSSPSPSMSMSMSPMSGSPSPSSTTSTMATTPMIAVASGPKSDTLALVSPEGDKDVLVPGDGRIITDIAISPGGSYIAYNRLETKKRWMPGPSTLMIYDVAGDSEMAISGGPSSSSVFPAFAAKAVGGHAWSSDSVLIAVGYVTPAKNMWTNGSFWRCDLAAKTATPLAGSSGTLEGTEPTISEDGTRLAFVSYSDYKKETLNSKGWVTKPAKVTETLNLFDADGDALTTISTYKRTLDYEGGAFGTPTISPDGTMIFSQSTGSDVGFGVTIWGDDGSKVYTTGGLVFPGGADWDKSGSGMLAFAGSQSKSATKSGIMLYDPSTDTLSSILVSKKLWPLDVAWSPDGTSLAYTVWSKRYNYRTADLYLTDPAGASSALLLSDAGEPSFGEVAVP